MTGNPGQSDTLCPSESGATQYTMNYSAETYGQVSDKYSACTGGGCSSPGSHLHFTYDPNGLLLSSAEQNSVSQADGSTLAPVTAYEYDSYGNLIAKNSLNGSITSAGTSTFNYDGLNRLVSTADADGATSCTWYYPNGSVRGTESAAERAAEGNPPCGTAGPDGQYAENDVYDADGNLVELTTYYGCMPSACTPATTYKWYDASDRLVELSQQHDASDVYSIPWLTKYEYDLSRGGTVSISTASGSSETFSAHGNLFSVQTYLPTYSQVARAGWRDGVGFAYDSLDRAINKYITQPNVDSKQTWQKFTINYDGNAQAYGLPTTAVDPLGQTTTYAYDAIGRLSTISFTNPTTSAAAVPTRQYVYDPDSNEASVTASSQTYTYQYDLDDRLTEKAEPSTFPASATLTYGYDPNGQRSSLTVVSNALAAIDPVTGAGKRPLAEYSYYADGNLKTLTAQFTPQNSKPNGATIPSPFTFTYSPAGRFLTMTDALAKAGTTGYSVQATYDGGGRMKTYTIPIGSYSAPGAGSYALTGYDAEGEPTQEVESGPGVTSSTLNYTYTVRGDLASSPGAQFKYADGFGYPVTSTPATFDPINDVKISGAPACVAAYHAGGCASYASTPTWTYDAAGRESQGNYEAGGTNPPGTFPTFDEENHLTYLYDQGPGNGWAARNNYVWGPDGHLSQILMSITGSGYPVGRGGESGYSYSQYETVHWDGDQVLYTANGNGQVDDVKIGAFVDMVSGYGNNGKIGTSWGVPIVWYRDPWGRQTACAVGPPVKTLCSWSTPNQLQSTVGEAYGVLYLMDTDNETVGDYYNAFIGDRTYDENLQEWTTPDQGGADVNDPLSIKPYAYLHNNPNEYSDPTGDDVIPWILNPGASSSAALPVVGEIAGGIVLAVALAPTLGQIANGIGHFFSCIFGCGGHSSIPGAPSGGLLALVLGTEALGLGPEDPVADAAVAAEIGIAAEGAEAAGSGSASLLGQSFGKLGTVVENPELDITGFTNHGINQAITRGVSPQSLLGTVNNPSIVLQQSGGQYLYLSNEAGVVLNPAGRVITTYPSSMFGPNVTNVLGSIPP